MKQKLLDDGTLYVEVKHALQVKRVLIEDREHWGTMFYPEDPIDLVRCEDCIHSDWHKDINGEWRCYCTEHGSGGHKADDFCSYGERKERE